MKNEGHFPGRLKKPVHAENQSTEETPPSFGIKQSDSVPTSRNRELKRDDHLPPAAGEYERYRPNEEPASPSTRAPLSIVENGRDPDETDTNSPTSPNLEQK
ncbi:hypothetical protein [Bacillus sp. OxB-1]|uniref:hypothetical protein n=1 Tax=Bacillus sp. (strain OxB-1) TaxID=98228 RepID=UPI00059731C4|nr:hypothetical protein [Bacillus sp. OxB-1]